MSGFDPITYAMAREAKIPAGALLPGFAVDPAVLQQGWCHLDGSLVSRSQYPLASQIIGDVRFQDGTPTEVQTDITMRSGVTSMSNGKALAVGDVFIVAPTQSAASSQGNFRLWRSGDAGANWSAIDLPSLPQWGTSLIVDYLEWFGGGRILLVIRAIAAGTTGYVVTFSNDYGQTWSVPKSLAASSNVTLQSVSADAEMAGAGQGYYYFGFQDSSVSPARGLLYALNVGTNTAYSYTVASDGTNAQHCQLLGGRVVSGGTSEVHFATYESGAWGSKKITFSGSGFSGYSASGIVYNSAYYGLGRLYLTANAGNHFITRGTAVYQLPAAWSGTPTLVHTGVDNVGQRLLTNTLSNPDTGERFDLATGVKTVVPGLNAGVPKVGSLYGFTNRAWIEALITDKQPSADRHFMRIAGQPGSFAVRSTRCADNFMGSFISSPDSLRFVTYAANSINWYDPVTGQYKVVDLTGGSPYKLRVRTYAQANDYANYLHLPYLPGVLCRMR
jgi:hypothetical protein